VESAIGLSEKYAKLSEEAAVLRQENQNFTTKNQQFKERVTNLEAQLQQTQKELSEATNFLIDMRIELNNWKTDVLGFRDEMRRRKSSTGSTAENTQSARRRGRHRAAPAEGYRSTHCRTSRK